MDPKKIDWDSVRVFLAIARSGRLAEAAERLELDVSTVSRRLDRVESLLGVHLFDRTREGTVMTPAAESMLPAAEEVERAVAEFVGAVSAVETRVEGTVRLTCPPGVAESFVAPALARFRAVHPGVRVELEASVGYANLTRREADLAIRATRPQSGDLVVTRLAHTRAVVLAAPELAERLGRLERMEDAPWISWGLELAQIPIARWLARFLGAAEPVLRTSHFASQLSAARAGLGLVVAPEPFRDLHVLAEVPPGRALAAAWEALPEEDLWLVGHRALRNVPRVAALWAHLLASMNWPVEPAPTPKAGRGGARRSTRG